MYAVLLEDVKERVFSVETAKVVFKRGELVNIEFFYKNPQLCNIEEAPFYEGRSGRIIRQAAVPRHTPIKKDEYEGKLWKLLYGDDSETADRKSASLRRKQSRSQRK